VRRHLTGSREAALVSRAGKEGFKGGLLASNLGETRRCAKTGKTAQLPPIQLR